MSCVSTADNSHNDENLVACCQPWQGFLFICSKVVGQSDKERAGLLLVGQSYFLSSHHHVTAPSVQIIIGCRISQQY